MWHIMIHGSRDEMKNTKKKSNCPRKSSCKLLVLDPTSTICTMKSVDEEVPEYLTEQTARKNEAKYNRRIRVLKTDRLEHVETESMNDTAL